MVLEDFPNSSTTQVGEIPNFSIRLLGSSKGHHSFYAPNIWTYFKEAAVGKQLITQLGQQREHLTLSCLDESKAVISKHIHQAEAS
jgi:hypothetical protein